MPAIRTHDAFAPAPFDDDALDMPPLVEPPPGFGYNLAPPPLIDYPFPEPARFEVLPDTFILATPPSSPESAPPLTPPSFAADDGDMPPLYPPGLDVSPPAEGFYAGAKSTKARYDADHIPRPPNAFILFRSSFIRSQQISGAVEGNHSTLSKIIGKCWKTLPPAQRRVWEDAAVKAQAEHRMRYPDWRFRPANAARKKPKAPRSGTGRDRDKGCDGGGGSAGARKKVKEREKDQDKDKDKDKVGDGGAKEASSTEEGVKEDADARATKIASLLVQGHSGRALEDALGVARGPPPHYEVPAAAAKDDAARVPLTAMFRRPVPPAAAEGTGMGAGAVSPLLLPEMGYAWDAEVDPFAPFDTPLFFAPPQHPHPAAAPPSHARYPCSYAYSSLDNWAGTGGYAGAGGSVYAPATYMFARAEMYEVGLGGIDLASF